MNIKELQLYLSNFAIKKIDEAYKKLRKEKRMNISQEVPEPYSSHPASGETLSSCF